MCDKHYLRWRRHGDPLGGRAFAPRNALAAFVAEAAQYQGSDCLIWPYGRQTAGYGAVNYGGRKRGAHTVVCELVHGSAPAEHVVAHTCGIPACVNPRHLRWDTQAGNHADKLHHGTHNRGERSPNAKLTEKEVKMIRSIPDRPATELAGEFGVSRQNIADIRAGRTWKWLTGAAAVAVLSVLTVNARAAVLGPPVSNDGLTYSLTENSISANGLVASFTFTASGYNTASDLQGGVNAGRSGLEAFAFNQPTPGSVVTGAVSTPPGYSFVLGGLNSGGCNMAGNFFCFDDTATPNAPPLAPGTLTFQFTVTANTAGVWANYATDLKVNWVGSANNYDLISQPIPVNIGTPPKVPEPGSLAVFGAGLVALGLLRRRRKLPTTLIEGEKA